MTTFLSFETVEDAAFPADCTIGHRCLTLDEAKGIVNEGVAVAFGLSLKTVAAHLREAFGMEGVFPSLNPPAVSLGPGDRVLVVSISTKKAGEPVTDRSWLVGSRFRFGLWTVGQVNLNPAVW